MPYEAIRANRKGVSIETDTLRTVFHAFGRREVDDPRTAAFRIAGHADASAR